MRKILCKLESFFRKRISRRAFIGSLMAGILYTVSGNPLLRSAFAKTTTSKGRPGKKPALNHDLVLAEGTDPYKNTRKAVTLLGGMEKFVTKGEIVVVKPNMAWDRSPEQAANTNPMVIAALVDMAYEAGAKRVNVFDVPCNDDKRVYAASGIKKAAEERGAYVFFVDHWNVVKAEFPYTSTMSGWPILRNAVECDTFINAPVLKHHRLAGLTLSMKNLMGVCSGKRGLMHLDIGDKLVDLTDFIKPDLTVIDGTRYLMDNGPSGGDLKDVKVLNKIIASADPVLADTYACTLVGKDPMEVPYLKAARERNFGDLNIQNSDILTVTV